MPILLVGATTSSLGVPVGIWCHVQFQSKKDEQGPASTDRPETRWRALFCGSDSIVAGSRRTAPANGPIRTFGPEGGAEILEEKN